MHLSSCLNSTSGPGEVSTARDRGWAGTLPIANCRMPIGCLVKPIGNRQSKIGNEEVHPLPRGATDLTGTAH